MSANTTTTPQPGLPTPAQLLEPLTTDPSTATTTTTPGTDDAVQAAVQGFTDRLLRAAAAQPPQALVQDTETQTQTQTPAEEHRKESIAHFIWTAYNDLLDAAQRTPPARQGRLLDFVERLRETVVKGKDGQVLVYEGGELWEGLPTLGWVVRDRWNFGMFFFFFFFIVVLCYGCVVLCHGARFGVRGSGLDVDWSNANGLWRQTPPTPRPR